MEGVSSRENDSLVRAQTELLLRSHSQDLERGNFRSVVEGIGPEFKELHVEIYDGRQVFQIGPPLASKSCHSNVVDRFEQEGAVRVTLCRPYSSPWFAIVGLIGLFFFGAIVSFRTILLIEREAITTLIRFFRSQGVQVNSDGGLSGVLSKVHQIQEELNHAKRREMALVQSEALALIATQVSHDIRSPLAALLSALERAGFQDEGTKELMQGAATRIRDIANQLLERARGPVALGRNLNDSFRSFGQQHIFGQESRTVEPISRLLRDVVLEKRVQYSSRVEVNIGLYVEPIEGCFSEVNAIELAKALSNLIDNSVEAIEGPGQVTVLAELREECISIQISDNGQGIAPQILSRLGRRGETHGKAQGTGLGLFQVRTAFEAWGGQVGIQSSLGEGTTITLTLPIASAPSWFVNKIEIARSSVVVIIAEGPETLNVLLDRFEELNGKSELLTLLQFHSRQSALEWYWKNLEIDAEILFFLSISSESQSAEAFEWIEFLGVGSSSILIVDQVIDPQLRDQCNRLGVRVLLKGQVHQVPISLIV